MQVTLRRYGRPDDFYAVSNFLVAHFQPGNRDGNWLQPTWEYMHSHPYLDEASLNKIGIWECKGEIVGVAHYESTLGEVFLQLHPAFAHLKPAMLAYAEENLVGTAEDGGRFVAAFVADFDLALTDLVRARGYELAPERTRPMTQFAIPRPFPAIAPPAGFRLKSLADDNDLNKIHRVLWRGFNHPGEPPPEGIAGRVKMQSGPNFRHDLTIVVEAPGGDFVGFSGTWYDGVNRIAYVEPVATDPDTRRLGLGRAAVLEGIRRCGELGATVAFVGSDQPFYRAIGFTRCYDSRCWVKRF